MTIHPLADPFGHLKDATCRLFEKRTSAWTRASAVIMAPASAGTTVMFQNGSERDFESLPGRIIRKAYGFQKFIYRRQLDGAAVVDCL